ncbi:MAG: hypothetical protein AAFX03_14285 [Pseudomonadota bacterium]
MLKDLIKRAADETGLTQTRAREALGVVFNAAERQASPFAEELFTRLPGARTLSAKVGSDVGAATGVIARLIEQTPGGRRHVASSMIRKLHAIGLGHEEIGQLLPAVSHHVEEVYGLTGFGHLGDLLGVDLDAESERGVAAAAA